MAMKIKLDTRLNAMQNAAAYFDESKKFKAKIEGAQVAIAQTRKLISEKTNVSAVTAKAGKNAGKPPKRQTQWFEKFNWCITTGGLVVVGGRDANDNDALYANRLQPNDLFYHADIRGASAVILKVPPAREATEIDKLEAAQFAASYSSAWKRGFGSVDVYCVKAGQVSKHATGGFVGKGGFAIEGQREWFKNTQVGLCIYFDQETQRVQIAPVAANKPNAVQIMPGDLDKKSAAKTVKSFLERILSKQATKLSEADIEHLLPGACDVLPPF